MSRSFGLLGELKDRSRILPEISTRSSHCQLLSNSPNSSAAPHLLAPALLKSMPQTTGVTTYSLETESSLTIPKLRRRERQKIRIRDKEEAEKIGEGICSWYPLGNSEHIFLKEQLFMAFVLISPIIALTLWYPREKSPFCCGSYKL